MKTTPAVPSGAVISEEETSAPPAPAVRENVGQEKACGEVREEQKAGEVSAAITTESRPVPADPEADTLARVEQAMKESGPTLPGGDSASGTVENRPPVQDMQRQDSVVTVAFVRDVARWLVSGYVPSRREGRGGRTTATLMYGNFRYSNSGALRSVERDPLKSRSGVLNYVFTPGMLKALYRMYAPCFVEEMERAARSGRSPLSDAQVADMFLVYAGEFQRLSASLDAAAGADLAALSSAVRRAAEKEAAANDGFARAYTALSLAREAGNKEEVAIQSRRMEECSREAGMYAARQERARADMVHAIRRSAEGKTLSSAELVFLGEWLSRRRASEESVRAAAFVCRSMAGLCEQRARLVLFPEAAVEGENRQAEVQNVISPEAEPSSVKEESAAAPEARDETSAVEVSGRIQTPVGKTPDPGDGRVPEGASSESFVREVSGPLSFAPPSSDTEAGGASAGSLAEPAAEASALPGEAAGGQGKEVLQTTPSPSGERAETSAPAAYSEPAPQKAAASSECAEATGEPFSAALSGGSAGASPEREGAGAAGASSEEPSQP